LGFFKEEYSLKVIETKFPTKMLLAQMGNSDTETKKFKIFHLKHETK
jgi:hypothetical protein